MHNGDIELDETYTLSNEVKENNHTVKVTFVGENLEKENIEDKQIYSENNYKCDQCDFESVQKNGLLIHIGMIH